MHVRIHSIETTLFEGNARSLTLPTSAGEITVLPHHRPLLSELREGLIRVTDNDGQLHAIAVTSGFLEVKKNGEVSVLVDSRRV